MSEIKDMYDRHPSIKSVKSITPITVITRRVVSIDFYRLIDTIDNVYVIDIDSYRFIERFSDIDFYRLPTSVVRMADQYLPIVIARVSVHKNSQWHGFSFTLSLEQRKQVRRLVKQHAGIGEHFQSKRFKSPTP